MGSVYLKGPQNDLQALVSIMHAAGCGAEYEAFLAADAAVKQDPGNQWKIVNSRFCAQVYSEVKPRGEDIPEHLILIYGEVVERLLDHGFGLEMM